MKRNVLKFLCLAIVLSAGFPASAQNKDELSAAYSRRYDLIVSKLGADGVGLETILDQWEKVDSLNVKMLTGKFNYYFTKSQTRSVEIKPMKKFLGADPVLTLKDSTGADVNYFEEIFYDDSLFSMSLKALDRAVDVEPARLDLRFLKAAALIAYEKDSPDMALSYLISLIEKNQMEKPEWVYPGFEMNDEFFSTSMQEYCYTFFRLGTISSYEAFRILSERMMEVEPKNPIFLSNMGTYNFVVLKDYPKALKCYNKVLKMKPDDYTAIKNCILLARSQKNLKLEKKYLPKLIEYGPEDEKITAQARLDALKK